MLEKVKQCENIDGGKNVEYMWIRKDKKAIKKGYSQSCPHCPHCWGENVED